MDVDGVEAVGERVGAGSVRVAGSKSRMRQGMLRDDWIDIKVDQPETIAEGGVDDGG